MTPQEVIPRLELTAHFLSKVFDASSLDEAHRAGRAALTELEIVQGHLRNVQDGEQRKTRIPDSVGIWFEGRGK